MNKENSVFPWYSISPLLKSTNHAVVLIIHIIWLVFLISCDRLTVFHLIDSLHPFPSAHGSPLGSVLEHRNSSSGLGLLEKHLSRAGVRLHLSDGRRRGHICTTGETLHNTQWDNCTLTAYARLYDLIVRLCASAPLSQEENLSYCIALYWTKSTIAGNSKIQYLKSTQTLNVNVIFYCHKWLYCVCFEINTEKQTSWDHNELFGFGPDLIGGSTVVVAKVALRLWIDLGQIKRMH